MLHETAVGETGETLRSVATIAWSSATTDAEAATATFYYSVAQAITEEDPTAARVSLDQALGLDMSRRDAWIAELAAIGPRHQAVLGLIPHLLATKP